MAAMAGATLAELQQRLGHSSVNAALRYQHAAQGRDRQIAEALSRCRTRTASSSFGHRLFGTRTIIRSTSSGLRRMSRPHR